MVFKKSLISVHQPPFTKNCIMCFDVMIVALPMAPTLTLIQRCMLFLNLCKANVNGVFHDPFSSIEMLTLTFKFQKLGLFNKDWPPSKKIKQKSYLLYLPLSLLYIFNRYISTVNLLIICQKKKKSSHFTSTLLSDFTDGEAEFQ